MDLERRQRMAAERILENESLRQGLDDDGATALLNWGVACAKQIAAETSDLEDDEEAEENTYPRTRALRRLLENVKNLYRPYLLPAQRQILLEEILELASVVYGPQATLPERIYWDSSLASVAIETGEKINRLRNLLELPLKSEGE